MTAVLGTSQVELLGSAWFDSVQPVDRGELTVADESAASDIDLTFGMGEQLADATAAELRALLLAQTTPPPVQPRTL